jgi:hypothetical protein
MLQLQTRYTVEELDRRRASFRVIINHPSCRPVGLLWPPGTRSEVIPKIPMQHRDNIKVQPVKGILDQELSHSLGHLL